MGTYLPPFWQGLTAPKSNYGLRFTEAITRAFVYMGRFSALIGDIDLSQRKGFLAKGSNSR